ncbi:MAG: HAMP domain-containing sensor histidine kinase [Oscillospiraceae bacterium]
MQKSIFTKYFSVCATLIIVSISILGALFLVFASQYFKDDKYKLLLAYSQRAAEVAQEDLAKYGGINEESASNIYGTMAKTIDAAIFITDKKGVTIYCTEKRPCYHMNHSVDNAIMSALNEKGEYSEMGRLGEIYAENYYTVASPVVDANNQTVAYVFTSTFASKQLQMFLGEILKMFVISAVTVLILTFIIIYFVSAHMAKPLRQMLIAAQKFGNGEFDTRLEVTSYDETGQLAMALNNMAQSLSTVETMRRSFTANVSHELKTPMTSIGGFIDGILDGTIPPEKHRYYLKIVSAETKRLAILVKTMLNLSKIEAGEMQIKTSKINILDTICQIVFSFETQIEAKHLDIRGLDHKKVMVDADPDLIHQVIYNLTENAVKFVNDGGYLEFSFSTDQNSTFISIKNSGEGLEKDEIPKLFDRFYKSDKSRGLDKNGVGLGLYIVRSIVNLHGGDVIVRSVKGEYAEFVFSITSAKEKIIGNRKFGL